MQTQKKILNTNNINSKELLEAEECLICREALVYNEEICF